jgi:hypothetical protein
VILLVTNECDLTTDYVVLELQRRSIPYFRLNTERLATAQFRARPAQADIDWEIDFSDRRLCKSDVSAAYFRRPAAPIPPGLRDSTAQDYSVREWVSLLQSLYTLLGNLWLNSPTQIAIAENKLLQLSVAYSIGLRVPETLVTNDFLATTKFLNEGLTIAKPLHSGLLEDPQGGRPERVVFTSRLTGPHMMTPPAIEAAPVILQREIKKAFDIRATVVGDRVFAASINSQDREETRVDWRRGSRSDLLHAPHQLPTRIASACVAVLQRLGLRFGAIDLILDPNGEYWFLEANPNGQWAWIETRTGLPIAAAIVDELLYIAQSS